MSAEEKANGKEMTAHAVRLTASAAVQTAAALEWVNDTSGADAAEEWDAGIKAVWASLATLPERYPVADENRVYQKKHPGPPLRVCLYRRGRNTWRLLLTVQEATADDPATVIIHQFRHGAQKPLTKWPEE